MSKLLRDTATVFAREFMPALREPLGLAFAMGQPLLFLFVFGWLLEGANSQWRDGSSWQWFVPGILVMMCLFGPMSAGYSLLIELMGGATERMMVTPLNRTAMLVGRTLKESVILLAQGALIIAMALPLGFRLYPIGALAGLALLTVFGIGLGSLSFVIAIASQPSGTLFWVLTQTLMFPLILLSGVLMPMEYGPGWLQVIAALNPVSYIVDAQRTLFAGGTDMTTLYGTVVAGAIAVLGLMLGTRAMRRGV